MSATICNVLIPVVSCKTEQKECSIRVTNLSFEYELSQTSITAKKALDLTITNLDVDKWDIDGVEEILNGKVALTHRQYEVDAESSSATKILIHFFDNIITDNLSITLILKKHGDVETYSVSVSDEGVTSSEDTATEGFDLITQLIPEDKKKIVSEVTSVLINDRKISEYDFDKTTSTLTIGKDYINGNVLIFVNLENKYLPIDLQFDEGQEDYVHLLNDEPTRGVDYETDLEINAEVSHNFAFDAANLKITIGESQTPLEPFTDYTFTIDSRVGYKAKLKINGNVLLDTIHIYFKLIELQEGTCFVYYTDGVTTIASPLQFIRNYGFHEQVAMPDVTKDIDEIVLYSRDAQGEKTEIDKSNYKLLGDQVFIFPDAFISDSTDNFLIDVYSVCKEGTTFRNDTWENVGYYTTTGWDHFNHIYEKTLLSNTYVGEWKEMKIGSDAYHIRVVAEKFHTLVDKTTLEGEKALLTFEFDNIWPTKIGFVKWENIESDLWKRNSWNSNSTYEPRKDYVSAISDFLNTGAFYNAFPETIREYVKLVENWQPTEMFNPEKIYKWRCSENKFFIANPMQVNLNYYSDNTVLGASYYGDEHNEIFPYYIDTPERVKEKRKKETTDARELSYWLSAGGWITKNDSPAVSICNEKGVLSGTPHTANDPNDLPNVYVVPVFCL